ncbi:hypothetical protein [Candidatus Hepatobacter penaei]|uniref:hypothetical protein n=1 Tax=Candidatus Hepatobacter penaei TaxID=1274402 RepID=UPI00109358AD|nr:hypothetical protein [Candidatus Hepatobacter penaei]TGW14631.1 hypothetical protein EIL50_04385 [bacterium NHP-B]
MKNVSLFVSLCLGASTMLMAGPSCPARNVDLDASPPHTATASSTTPRTPQKPARKATDSSLSSATSTAKDEATEEAGAAGESLTNSFLQAEGSENDDEAAGGSPSPQKKPLRRQMFLKIDEARGDGPVYPSPNPLSVGHMMASPDADSIPSNVALPIHSPSDEPRPTPRYKPNFDSSSDRTPPSKRKEQSAGPASASKRAKNEDGWESN